MNFTLRSVMLLAGFMTAWSLAQTSETIARQSTSTQNATEQAPTEFNRSNTKGSHANDLLLHGTAYNEHALALSGVRIIVRRSGEKKIRREDHTNFRGDFAIRVPQGANYEVTAELKGYAKQVHKAEGQDGRSEEKLIFRMEPVSGGKK